jgi:dolichol-phosphate mannosyltransferase
MLNPQSKSLSDNAKIEASNLISIVLLTQDPRDSTFELPDRVISTIPKEISREIIVVHYNSPNEDGHTGKILRLYKENDSEQKEGESILHFWVKKEFASAVKTGIEESAGKFILVVDVDNLYSKEIVPQLIIELIKNPNSIIVASRYVQGARMEKMPIIETLVRKGARLVARYGLKVKYVEDPLSNCFAFSRHLLKEISFEGKGKEALLEILVKVNNKSGIVPVKEIPITQQGMITIANKVNFNRVLNYSKAVWDLYRYGKTSKQLNDRDIVQQRRHKSILFLSKAGRFFTVGASGLAINYAISYLFSNLVPSIWYMQATLIGILVSITTNFLLNKLWTFEDRDFSVRHFFRQYSLFLALCSLGAVIQLTLVYLFV